MQHKKKTWLPKLVLITAILASFNTFADDPKVDDLKEAKQKQIKQEEVKPEEAKQEEVKQESVVKDDESETTYGGSFSLGYRTNIYHPDDYRSSRSLSWSASFRAKQDKFTASISTGAYRSLEDKTGDFFTDSSIGLSYSSLAKFGETGNVSMSGRLTIPNSESSRKQQLITAVQLSVPVRFKVAKVGISVSPRIRKNFHKYKTIAGRSLSEWVYSISTSANISSGDFSFGTSIYGSNSQSYQGTRRTSINYGGSVYGSYRVADYLSISVSASSGGVYKNAEQGTSNNIDLFNSEKANYVATATFSF